MHSSFVMLLLVAASGLTLAESFYMFGNIFGFPNSAGTGRMTYQGSFLPLPHPNQVLWRRGNFGTQSRNDDRLVSLTSRMDNANVAFEPINIDVGKILSTAMDFATKTAYHLGAQTASGARDLRTVLNETVGVLKTQVPKILITTRSGTKSVGEIIQDTQHTARKLHESFVHGIQDGSTSGQLTHGEKIKKIVSTLRGILNSSRRNLERQRGRASLTSSRPEVQLRAHANIQFGNEPVITTSYEVAGDGFIAKKMDTVSEAVDSSPPRVRIQANMNGETRLQPVITTSSSKMQDQEDIETLAKPTVESSFPLVQLRAYAKKEGVSASVVTSSPPLVQLGDREIIKAVQEPVVTSSPIKVLLPRQAITQPAPEPSRVQLSSPKPEVAPAIEDVTVIPSTKKMDVTESPKKIELYVKPVVLPSPSSRPSENDILSESNSIVTDVVTDRPIESETIKLGNNTLEDLVGTLGDDCLSTMLCLSSSDPQSMGTFAPWALKTFSPSRGKDIRKKHPHLSRAFSTGSRYKSTDLCRKIYDKCQVNHKIHS